MDIHNTKQRYKRAWKEKAERIVKKRLKLKEQQDYILKKVHTLLEPKCSFNCNSSNNSNNNLSISIESEENLVSELIDLNHSQDEVEIQNDVAFEKFSHDMSFDENTNKNENRNENENIYNNENTDESENRDENECMNENENTDESEDENVNMVFENDEQKENYVLSVLRKWALSGGVISMSKIDELLTKLRPVFNNIPKSYKTLLKTDHIHVIPFRNGGQFWYQGIQNDLDGLILENYLQVKGKIEIDINADGLPLFRSSKNKFWPILGQLIGSKNEPFIIAIYFENSDPTVDICDMNPITSHVTALTSTPRSSCRSDSVLSNVSEVAFDVNKAFENKIYTLIQEMSSKLDVTIMNQCRLNRYLLPHENRIIRPTNLPALPLTTKEELEKFEKFLSKDDNTGATICYMSQIIGPKDNIKEATYKILKKLISNTLASKFTLKGAINLSKQCFDKLALYEVVQVPL